MRALAVVAGFLLVGGGSLPAAALPPDPLDEDPVIEETFTPPANGFSWYVQSRFGQTDPTTGLVNYHWSSAERPLPGVPVNQYDPAYARPTALNVAFDGCPTEAEETGPPANTYLWELVQPGGSISTVAGPAKDCQPVISLPINAQTNDATHTIRLTITEPAGAKTTHERAAYIKDLLIVAIGDSIGSGEGNPDFNQTFDSLGFGNDDDVWEDLRCHRSAAAGPGAAARTIENDPATSVTFLSFACSGAAIATYSADDESTLDPYAPASGNKDVGSGILDTYRGIEAPGGTSYSVGSRLQSQIDQMRYAVGGRRIDALVVAAGGNDIGFGRIAGVCVLVYNCRDRTVTGASGSPVTLGTRLQQDVVGLAPKYDQLATALNNLKTSNLIDISKLYLVEYPDPTRDSSGNVCSSLLEDVLSGPQEVIAAFGALIQPVGQFAIAALLAMGAAPPYAMSNDVIFGKEVDWASTVVQPALTAAQASAATRHQFDAVPWQLIGGIAADFQKDASGVGHGYCSSYPWFRRAAEAAQLQGPTFLLAPNAKTKGTLHPNRTGQDVIARHIVSVLEPALAPPPASRAAPKFFTSDTVSSGNTIASPLGTATQTSTPGSNGWLVGTTAVAQVVATTDATTAVRSAGLTMNGTPVSCASPPAGVTCGKVNDQVFKFSFTFTADGIYGLDFAVSALNGRTSTFRREVKVDLTDPSASSASLSSNVAPSGGWYAAPVDVTLTGSDAVGGSGLRGIDYQLDGGPVVSLPNGRAVSIASDGTHALVHQAVDWAGREGPLTTTTVRVDRTAPIVVITNPVNTTYTLGQVVTASVSCTDGGSGIDSCSYPATADTASVGAKTYSAVGRDVAGNSAAATVSYAVAYRICVLYDQTKSHRAGSVVPIRVQLCDVSGADVSTPSVTLTLLRLVKIDNTASSVVDDAGYANADTQFRYDSTLPGYLYNLSTTGLTSGTWVLTFVASGDPLEHFVKFDVR